ncbi:helix-turn-helix transcriptional regulator [Clostridium botulinum]|uniref:helix-turn-helix transcriptional regulator n=1 Tax=Clostridium botulinum TaxID=1491 RepID=UPI001C9B820C|nr:helix-turn-helix transcriptional regulator [Clostridium botulinum]MBY6860776.1 helix-turn-helix transcriptional regulator [Clostridium botulinum]MBY7043835.1 helix-turn-helix transcriptional regulator [Clostridium botulinum]
MKGKLLKQLRNEKGLTQTEVGNAVGVSDSTIRMIETDKRNASLDLANNLADLFDVSLDYLEGRSTYRNASEVVIDILGRVDMIRACTDGQNIDDKIINIITEYIKNKK